MEQIFATISASGASSSANFESGFSAGGVSESSQFESSSFGSAEAVGGSFGASSSGFDVATAAFNSVDSNQDGGISREEFAQFFQKGL